MSKNSEDNLFLGDKLREILKQKNLTYRELAKKSGVSLTYITQIITHGKNPSMEIIQKIFKALDVKPDDFIEYRIIKIIRKIEKYYGYLGMIDIDLMENVLDNVIQNVGKNKEFDESKVYKGKRELEFNPSIILDITNFSDEQKKIIKYLYNEFNQSNKRKELESKIIEKFVNEFTKSEEFEDYLETYKYLPTEDIYEIALRDYTEKYLNKNK